MRFKPFVTKPFVSELFICNKYGDIHKSKLKKFLLPSKILLSHYILKSRILDMDIHIVLRIEYREALLVVLNLIYVKILISRIIVIE